MKLGDDKIGKEWKKMWRSMMI